MNRFSYLAAISSVLADDYHSSQTLVEKGLEEMDNLQTFKTTDVTATVANGGWFKMTATYAAAEHFDTAKCMDVDIKLVLDEYFLIEVNQLLDDIQVVGHGDTTPSFATPKFATANIANAGDVNTVVDKIAGTIVGANFAAATAFVKNYRYPTYRVQAKGDNTNGDGTVGYFGLVAKKGSDYHCKTWKTTVTTTDRPT